jgi:hypothetical protein
MHIAIQIMMGVSLAACAGLRAWLPLLCVGLLAKSGQLPLNPAFEFLARTDVLVVFGVATVLELLGDKIVAVDHFLDAIGTVLRPVAGTLVASSLLTGVDPAISVIIGLILGGGTALTVHSGKAAVRTQSTVTAPLHLGAGNAALSLGEDALSIGGIGLAIWVPVVAFILTLAAVAFCIWLILYAVREGKKRLRRSQTPNVEQQTPNR